MAAHGRVRTPAPGGARTPSQFAEFTPAFRDAALARDAARRGDAPGAAAPADAGDEAQGAAQQATPGGGGIGGGDGARGRPGDAAAVPTADAAAAQR